MRKSSDNGWGHPYFRKPPCIPSGKLTQLWKNTTFNGKIHYKWPFSIAMLNYQRVSAIASIPRSIINMWQVRIWETPSDKPMQFQATRRWQSPPCTYLYPMDPNISSEGTRIHRVYTYIYTYINMCDHVCRYLVILELNRLWIFNKTIVTKMLKHLKFYLLQDDYYIYIYRSN